MKRGQRPSAEQVVLMLRQIEVQTAQGKSIAVACKEADVSEQSYYRWRKEYGGLQVDQAKRMKDLERENARLRRLVADLSLEKQVLADVASGNYFSIRGSSVNSPACSSLSSA
ncbi:Transposase [Methylorubrum extorquens]